MNKIKNKQDGMTKHRTNGKEKHEKEKGKGTHEEEKDYETWKRKKENKERGKRKR